MTSNQIAYWNFQETRRHNLATEGEEQRKNIAKEEYDYAVLGETTRHNLAGEDYNNRYLIELNRHNLMSENIGYMQASAAQTSAAASMMNAKTNASMLPFNQSIAAAQAENLKTQSSLNKAKEMGLKYENQISAKQLMNWDTTYENTQEKVKSETAKNKQDVESKEWEQTKDIANIFVLGAGYALGGGGGEKDIKKLFI